MMNVTIREERISAEEYIDFLKRTDLGSQYPEERFEERIRKLVENVSVSLVARDENRKAVGVLFDPVHLGLVLRQHFQDVDLARLNPGDLFTDVDEDGVIVSAHLENSKFSAPGAIFQTSSPVAGSIDFSTSPSASIQLSAQSRSSMV